MLGVDSSWWRVERVREQLVRAEDRLDPTQLRRGNRERERERFV